MARRAKTCHRDLRADKVLPTADGGVCVIDCEDSCPADPCQELGCVLLEFARADPGRVRALIQAYPGNRRPSDGEPARNPLPARLRRTRRGVDVCPALSLQDTVRFLREKKVTLVYDQTTGTLQAGTCGAAKTIAGKAS
jgi:hypothetical protein